MDLYLITVDNEVKYIEFTNSFAAHALYGEVNNESPHCTVRLLKVTGELITDNSSD